MKKLIPLFLLGLLFITCSKKDEKLSPPTSSGIELKQNRISFNDEKSYTDIISKYQTDESSALNLLKPYKPKLLKSSTVESINSADSLYDPFLLEILNEDKIVEIGEWIIKVDMPNNKVFALHINDSVYINDLKDNQSNEKIYTFAPDQEVLKILNDSIKPGLKSTTGIFCGARYASSDYDKDDELYGDRYRLKCRLEYNKFGILFTIVAEVTNQTRLLGIWTPCDGDLWINYEGSWTPRCKGIQTKTDYCSNCQTAAKSKTVRLYYDIRALESYGVKAQFYNYGTDGYSRRYEIAN
ncbi:TPA: hypothetical protein ENS27_17755 [bacterium]|nr:hypothetical protein [bacterium]